MVHHHFRLPFIHHHYHHLSLSYSSSPSSLSPSSLSCSLPLSLLSSSWKWQRICVKIFTSLKESFCFTLGLDSLCAPFLSLNFNDEGENYNLRSKECRATSFYGKLMNLILPYSTCLRLFSGIYPQVSAQLLSKG